MNASYSSIFGSGSGLIIFGFIATIIPTVILSTSSYVKVSIVFSLLRSSFGGQNLPSAFITGILTLIITVNIMSPVWSQVLQAIPINQENKLEFSKDEAKNAKSKIGQLYNEILVVVKPLQDFMFRNISEKEVDQLKKIDPSIGYEELHNDFLQLTTVFILSEIKKGFEIGIVLYLVFLLIDLIVSTSAIMLGFNMINPTIISLPVKIIFFIQASGWEKLIFGLEKSYL